MWGWRSTFIALTAFSALSGLVVLLFIRKETHQYFVLRRLAKQDPDAAKRMQEWESVTSQAPVFHAPWVPLRWVKGEGSRQHGFVISPMSL